MYKREIWKSNENNKLTFWAFFFVFKKQAGVKQLLLETAAPVPRLPAGALCRRREAKQQEPGASQLLLGAVWTAVMLSGISWFVLLLQQSWGPRVKSWGILRWRLANRQTQESERGEAEHCQTAAKRGGIIKGGKKMSCHTCTGGRREHADKLQMHLAPEGLETSRASTPTLEKLGRKAAFLHSPTCHIAGLSGGTEWPLPSRKPFRFKRSVNILSYVCTGRR